MVTSTMVRTSPARGRFNDLTLLFDRDHIGTITADSLWHRTHRTGWVFQPRKFVYEIVADWVNERDYKSVKEFIASSRVEHSSFMRSVDSRTLTDEQYDRAVVVQIIVFKLQKFVRPPRIRVAA